MNLNPLKIFRKNNRESSQNKTEEDKKAKVMSLHEKFKKMKEKKQSEASRKEEDAKQEKNKEAVKEPTSQPIPAPKEKAKGNKSLENKFQKLKELKAKDLFKKKKKKFGFRGFAKIINLQDYLEKSGLERLDAKVVTKKISFLAVFIGLALSVVIILLATVNKIGLAKLLVFLLGFWLTVFFFILALVWAAYLFYLDMKIFKRTLAVEEVFPDFLQLTSANISAGMPIDKALWYAVRPGFGVLAKEIEAVAKNTMAGEDLGVALTSFAHKYNSKTIQRAVSLLLEGMAAGGEMAELLTKISLDIEDTKILKKEMAANVTTYIIFITFATIIAAPVLFGLATQLLIVIKQITSSLGTTMTASSSMFSFSFSADSIKTTDFRIFAYLMLIISAVSSACIVSIIKKGRVKEGISKIPTYVAVSVVIYFLSCIIIGSMFGGMI